MSKKSLTRKALNMTKALFLKYFGLKNIRKNIPILIKRTIWLTVSPKNPNTTKLRISKKKVATGKKYL